MKVSIKIEDPSTTVEEKTKLRTLYHDIIIPLYKKWYSSNSFTYAPTELKWDHTRATYDVAGIYELFRDMSSNDLAKQRKFGMSFSCHSRTSQQPNEFVSKLMDRNDIRNLLSSSPGIIDTIIGLGLPGLAVHDDYMDEIKDLISMQLAEGFWACSYHCVTMTILERLVELPSQAVRDAIAVPNFSTDVLDFFHCGPIAGTQGLFGWPTLRSALAKMNSEYLDAKLQEGSDQFVTLNRFQALFGSSKPTEWIDCYDRCPREDALETVTSSIDALLTSVDLDDFNYNTEDQFCAMIREALAPIQGENYNHYYQPTTSVWGKYGKEKLSILLKTLPQDWLLWMERASFTCIQSEAEEWLSNVIDFESAIEVIPDNPQSCCLMKTYDGRRIIVSASHFTMFDTISSSKNRTEAARSFLTQLELMSQVGIIDKSDYEPVVVKERNILQSFLMRVHSAMAVDYLDDGHNNDEIFQVDDPVDGDGDVVDVLDGGVRSACRRALSKIYFPRPKSNIKVVSLQLKIGYMEMLYLREVLGRRKTNAVLVAHGFLWNNESISPLELEYECGGVPAVGSFPARPCCNGRDSECIVMAGRNIPDHVFDKLFLCMSCHRRLPAREYEVLSSMPVTSMTTNQVHRLEVLNRQRTDHNERNRVNPSNGGPENTNSRSRNRVSELNRRRRRRRRREGEGDGGVDEDVVPSTVEKKKKKSGINRSNDTAKTRPQIALKAKMVKALSLYIPLTGEPEIWKNHIIALLDRVLIKYAPKANIPLYYTKVGGKVIYNKHLYPDVATAAGLVKEGDYHYRVPMFVEGTKPSGEKQDVLLDTVMEMLSNDDENENDKKDDTNDDENDDKKESNEQY